MAEIEDPSATRVVVEEGAPQLPAERMRKRRAEPGGRVPPQAVDIEQSVLGAMLIEREAIPRVVEILQEDSFYSSKHQKIFQAILSLFERSNPVDQITLT